LKSLTDINKDFTSEQITKLEGLLKNSIGTWNENKRYISDVPAWSISFVSSGELLDLQKSPLVVKISDIEEIKVFEAVKSYYLDNGGSAQEIVIPLVAQMPDGKIIYFGPEGMAHFIDWTVGDDLVGKLKSLPWVPGFEKGSTYEIIFMPDVQAFANHFTNGFDTIRSRYNSDPILYMTQWISKYNLFYNEETQGFLSTGNNLKFVVPYLEAKAGLDNVDLSVLGK
jgi:hypothetical protein